MKSKEWTKLNQMQKETIEERQSSFPIMVGKIASELGIVVKKATLAAGISGEIREVENICVIKVNRHDVKARQRFTIAHEIAHFLLHREKIGNGIVDDILYRSNLSDEQEAEANRLAADIIMPWHLIKLFLENNTELKIEEKIEKLADISGVSTTAIKIRLGKL